MGPLPVVVSTLLLMHMVTQIFLLTASFRARKILPLNSLPILENVLRTKNVRSDGAATAAKIATTAIVTNNSMSVKPRMRERRVNGRLTDIH